MSEALLTDIAEVGTNVLWAYAMCYQIIIFRCRYMLCYQHIETKTNDRHFANDIFKCIFLNENVRISSEIWPNFVSKVPINNIPALNEIMACRR